MSNSRHYRFAFAGSMNRALYHIARTQLYGYTDTEMDQVPESIMTREFYRLVKLWQNEENANLKHKVHKLYVELS